MFGRDSCLSDEEGWFDGEWRGLEAIAALCGEEGSIGGEGLFGRVSSLLA